MDESDIDTIAAKVAKSIAAYITKLDATHAAWQCALK